MNRPETQKAISYTPWPKSDAELFIKEGVWQGKTLLQHFLDAAERYPDHFAILSPVPIRYRELKAQVFYIASTLKQRGINAQDTVVLQLPNCPAFVQYLLATFAIGAVPVMALPAHRSSELNHFLITSNAKAYVAMQTPAGGLGGFASLNDIAWQGELIAVESNAVITPVQLNSHEIAQLIEADTQRSAASVALLQLSGGTTGLPKLIPRTHNDYAYSIITSNKICAISDRSVFLCVLPAAHNFSLSSPGILGTLFAGGALVLADRLSADEAFSIIKTFTISHVALVPPLALNWLSYHRLKQSNDQPLTSLTSLLVGGAKLTPTSAKALIDELGAPLQQVFGMAEGLVNYTRLNDSIHHRCFTQGKPMSPLDEVLVVDDDDNPVSTGEAGHLLTKGPYTIRGYLNAPEHNDKSFTQTGFYRTGDIVTCDSDGYITVEGRNKDQINRGGEKVSAAELEDYLLRHPKIVDAAVVAIDDDYLGERTGAYLVTMANEPISLIECRQFLRQFDIADYKYPDKVFCTAKLPKTSFGKVSKKALRKLANERVTA